MSAHDEGAVESLLLEEPDPRSYINHKTRCQDIPRLFVDGDVSLRYAEQFVLLDEGQQHGTDPNTPQKGRLFRWGGGQLEGSSGRPYLLNPAASPTHTPTHRTPRARTKRPGGAQCTSHIAVWL